MRQMPESPPLYLSYVPSRPYSQVYKMHPELKNARAALSLRGNGYASGVGYWAGCRGGKIWKWDIDVEGRTSLSMGWVLLYDVEPGTRWEDLPWNRK